VNFFSVVLRGLASGFAKADTGAAAILSDEFNAAVFESAANIRQGAVVRQPFASLKISERSRGDF
jgi:hypothetical protein